MHDEPVKLSRSEAEAHLAAALLEKLSPEERLSYLLDHWPHDGSDDELSGLPYDLVIEVQASVDAPDDAAPARYDPLIVLALREEMLGFKSEYLENRCRQLGVDVVIEEVGPHLESCPVCGYRTLSRRGGFQVCRVCFWEDAGHTEPEQFSGPNHMTVGEARSLFHSVGAISAEAAARLPQDRFERYERLSPLPDGGW